MSELPRELMPDRPKTLGEEPDPPYPGWYEGGTRPTKADYCPYCDELVKYVNQHSGYENDGQRWHRKCHLLSRGYEEVEDSKNEKFPLKLEGEIQAPDTTIEYQRSAETFTMNKRTAWQYEDPLSEDDIAYLQDLADGDTEEDGAARHILSRVDKEADR